MVDRLHVDDADLFALDERRHRNDERELLGVALVVARHRDRGLSAVAGQHHFRRLVEQLRIRLRDIEAAERRGGAGRDLRRYRDERDAGFPAWGDIRLHAEAPSGWALRHAKRGAGRTRSMTSVRGDSAISAKYNAGRICM